MERLPPEIISNIVHEVRDRPLTPLSLLCRRWQPIAEAKIYRELHISYELPGSGQLGYKAIRNPSHKTLTNNLTPTRLSYIRYLYIEISRYGRDLPARSANIIRLLFDLLTRVPHNQEPLLNLHFRLLAGYFESDSLSSDTIEFSPDGLPELPTVRSFSLDDDAARMEPSPRALLYMASKMPRLRDLDVITLDFESIDQRVELARSLTDLPASIHSFFLRFLPGGNSEGLLVMENGEDILTRELRRFSQREGLKEFSFNGYVELSIFWPPDSATSEPRHWPTLESFEIQLRHPQHLASLDATDSLDNAQDANDSDGIHVHKGIMNASFRALAKCSAGMPKAKDNLVKFNDGWNRSLKYCTTKDPCVEVKGKPGLELDQKTVDEWRKTAGIHNLDFQMHIDEDTE